MGLSKLSIPVRSCLDAGWSPMSHCKVCPEVCVQEPQLLAHRNVASQFSGSQTSGLFDLVVYSGQHLNLEAMKLSVTKVKNSMCPVSSVSPDYIKKTCSKFYPQIEVLIEAEGGYID
jgi:hypothetical protein